MVRFVFAVLASGCILIAGCGANHHVLTDSQTQARQAAAEQQEIADNLRRSGASEAATQAQRRADQYEAKAARKPGSLIEWLADVLFTSLLTPSSGPAPQKR